MCSIHEELVLATHVFMFIVRNLFLIIFIVMYYLLKVLFETQKQSDIYSRVSSVSIVFALSAFSYEEV